MKQLIGFFMMLFIISLQQANAQEEKFTVYNPAADAISDVNEAVVRAKKEGKHVFLQIGGNWCKWCRMFYHFSNENEKVDSLFKADYIIVHINYSKENKNGELLKRLAFPQRFGFPVFVILDASGNRIHTQNTGYLEEGEGYNEKKVVEMLRQWNPGALLPEKY
jgi:uncharacterized protein YyaL (SSP411 family)